MAAPTIHATAALASTGSGTAGSLAVTLPTRSVGDLLLIDVSTVKTVAGLIALSAPGWYTAHERTNNTQMKSWLWRICDGTEASTVTVTANGASPTNTRWKARAISINAGTFDPNVPFDSSSFAGTSSGSGQTTFTGGSFTPSMADCLALVGLCQTTASVRNTTFDSPATELYDDSVLNHLCSIHGGYTSAPTSGVATAITGAWVGGTVTYVALTIVIRPVAAALPVPEIRDVGTLADTAGTSQISVDVPLPSSRTVGDLLLIDISVFRTAASFVAFSASGWTVKHTRDHSSMQKAWLWRICDGTETSPVTVVASGTNASSNRWKARCIAIKVGTFNAAAPFDSSSGAGTSSATGQATSTGGSFTPSQANCLAIGSLTYSQTSMISQNPDWPALELYDNSSASDQSALIAHRLVAPTSGVATAVTAVFNGSTTTYDALTIVVAPNPPTPTANFSATPTSGPVSLNVAFTDLTTNSPTSWDWDFGDGSSHATTQNPSHTYTAEGLYTVTLVATNVAGSDTETKVGYIDVLPPPPPTADFSATPTTGDAPLSVTFTDESTDDPTSWEWDLDGDGDVDSTLQNPVRVYDEPGTYDVTLTATNAYGDDDETKVAYITVTAPDPPVADFSGTPLSGDAPLSVAFTDESTGAPTSWAWDFDNDGDVDSTEQNPTTVYPAEGVYTVTLTVENSGGSDSETKTDYVTAVALPPPPVADFAASPTSGYAPLPVAFTDLSTGTPTAWDWDFGDGTAHGTTANPTHNYASPGAYNVTLTVTNAGGSDSETKGPFIVSVAPPVAPTADFTASPTSGTYPLLVAFTDTSDGFPTSWDWDFGDGSAHSTEQNPSHLYTSEGPFTVTLTVTNSYGTDTDTGAVTPTPPGEGEAVEGVCVAFLDAALEPNPTWTRIDNSTPTLVAEYSIRRGRQDEFEKTGTGTATIKLHDRDGLVDPTNPDSPWIGSIDGVQSAIALWNPVTDTWHPIFRGFVDEYDYDVHPSGIVTTVTMGLVDAMDYLAGCEVALGTAASGDNPPSTVTVPAGDVWFAADQVNLRIHKLLDQAGWPEELRVIFSGNVWVKEQTAAPGTAILQLLYDAADAEFPGVANLYVDGLGRVIFHGRHARFNPESTADTTGGLWDFTRWKAGDGSATVDPDYAQIRGLGFTRQRKQIINAALAFPFRDPDIAPGELTDADMAGQAIYDPLSIERYGVHSWSAESLMTWKHKANGNDDLEETQAMANYYVQNYAQPRTRLTQLQFRSLHPDDPRAAATWDLICGVEISDIIAVKTGHAGGGGFDDDEFYVEGISYDVRPLNGEYADVTLSLDVSPKAYYTFDPFVDE